MCFYKSFPKKCNLKQENRHSISRIYRCVDYEFFYTPGVVKSGKFGQFPSCPGSPPMRTHAECDGVGPSRINS